ncbi:MAG: hypothetical protein FWB86_03110 [Treponema sp.]|nr:hypothetical protein [Treponema sp.]MCL2251095.1 hypothetical protein [Treponema sp.]
MNKKLFFLFAIFILFFSYVWGQSDLKVSVRINPEIIITGESFTLTFIVDYPIPEDVSIIMPPFSGALVLDRFLRTPHIVSAGRQTSFGQTSLVQTSLEFRLIPYISGRIVLGPFSVVTPNGTSEIEAVVLNIRSEKGEQIFTRSLRWEGIPLRITAGERVTFVLRMQTDINNLQSARPSSFFMPEVPQGVILSQSQITAQERERGVVLKLTLIPLSGGEFFLPERILQHENLRFEIPELRISINNR